MKLNKQKGKSKLQIPWLLLNPAQLGGGLKENGQNTDSGSKNSENQNNDAVS